MPTTKKDRNYLRKNETLVKCPLCEEELITAGKKNFYHCNKTHTIEGNIVLTPEDYKANSQIDNPPNPEDSGDKQTAPPSVDNGAGNTAEAKSNSSEMGSNEPVSENTEPTLEIEEQPDDNEFKCPICSAKVKEYQDCSSCGAELIWSED